MLIAKRWGPEKQDAHVIMDTVIEKRFYRGRLWTRTGYRKLLVSALEIFRPLFFRQRAVILASLGREMMLVEDMSV